MSENKDLVHIQSQVPAVASDNSFEVNFSEIKKISPFTLSIDQPLTEKEDVKPGMLRVQETGQLRKEVKVVMIQKPRETRAYQIGTFPNQQTLCFSRDMLKPDPRSQDMQAMVCSGCKHASWEKFNKTKDINDAPKCKITSHCIFIDYENLYPVEMYIRGKSRSDGLETGLQQIVQQFIALKMMNGTVAWTDVVLTLTTEKGKKNNNYVLKIKDVHPVTAEERGHLVTIVGLIAAQRQQMMARIAETEAAKQAAAVDDEVTKVASNVAATVIPKSNAPIDGEYVEPKGSVEEI